MPTILGRIFIFIAITGLFVVALIAFPKFRRAVSRFFKAIGTWCRKHWLACIVTAAIILAIAMNNTTARLLAPFSQLAFIVLGICIMLLAFSKSPKFKRYCWRVGTIAVIIVLVSVLLEKLPW